MKPKVSGDYKALKAIIILILLSTKQYYQSCPKAPKIALQLRFPPQQKARSF